MFNNMFLNTVELGMCATGTRAGAEYTFHTGKIFTISRFTTVFFFFFFFFAALTDLTLASKRPMNSMGPTGAQKSAPGPIFQDRHSGNIVINVGRGGGALPKIDCHRSRV